MSRKLLALRYIDKEALVLHSMLGAAVQDLLLDSAFDSSSLFLRFQIYSKLPPVMFFHVDPAAKFD